MHPKLKTDTHTACTYLVMAERLSISLSHNHAYPFHINVSPVEKNEGSCFLFSEIEYFILLFKKHFDKFVA